MSIPLVVPWAPPRVQRTLQVDTQIGLPDEFHRVFGRLSGCSSFEIKRTGGTAYSITLAQYAETENAEEITVEARLALFV